MLERNTEMVSPVSPAGEQHCQPCSLRQTLGSTKQGGKQGFTLTGGLRTSEIASFLHCSESRSLGAWGLTFVWIYWCGWSPGAGFLAKAECRSPGCDTQVGWLQREQVILPYIPPASQRCWQEHRAVANEAKSYFFQGKMPSEGESFSLHPVSVA